MYNLQKNKVIKNITSKKNKSIMQSSGYSNNKKVGKTEVNYCSWKNIEKK